MKAKRKELLALPQRGWNTASEYDSLLLVPTAEKHDSGFTIIAIVGVAKGIPVEIAATCDDICWSFPTSHPYDRMTPGLHRMVMRTDCLWPSGIMHVWASGEHYFKGRFRVGASLSSVDVTLLVEPVGDSARAAALPAPARLP